MKMKTHSLLGRGALIAALIGLAITPAAHADGVLIAGGSAGESIYKAGTDDLFVRYIGEQAVFTNDLYYYLTLPGAGQFLLRNNQAAQGTQIDVTGSSALAVGSEAIFGICAELDGAAPGSGCVSQHNYFMGPNSRNPDGFIHATVWTREAYLAGCALAPTQCSANITTLLSDPAYNIVVGFEDSFDGTIDHDYNDLVFAVRGATVTPEPVTMTLLATGLAGMGGASFFRRRRKA
jgi:hypothetical protein